MHKREFFLFLFVAIAQLVQFTIFTLFLINYQLTLYLCSAYSAITYGTLSTSMIFTFSTSLLSHTFRIKKQNSNILLGISALSFTSFLIYTVILYLTDFAGKCGRAYPIDIAILILVIETIMSLFLIAYGSRYAHWARKLDNNLIL